MRSLYFLLTFATVTIFADKVKYDNYKLYKLIPENLEDLKVIQNLEDCDLNLDFWKTSTGLNTPSDVLVAPEKEFQLLKELQKYGIKHEIIISNVQSIVDQSSPRNARKRNFGWIDYHNLDQIYEWLESLARTYPDKASIVIGGHSYEGRHIKGIKLSFKKGNKAVFIEGAIHAREWIAPAVITYILNEFLTSQNRAIREIADSYDWFIFPTINPDGYEYTHTTARFWRQNRKPHGLCMGVDLNRNWGYHWNEGGTSNTSCNEKYPGPYPFSEPETRTLSKYISSISDKLVAYLAFHSYSQLLLIPYGYTNSPPAENYAELLEIGRRAIDSLEQRHGTKFIVGKWDEAMYVSSGVSVEWVKGTFRTPITYTYELRDKGYYGFALPPEQIIPSAEETLDSLVTLISEMKARGY